MQLAQLNIARMLAPLGSELMREFEENLDPINTLAEQSKGFVWRLKEDDNNATSVRVFDDDMLLVNMSVWQSIQDLTNFAYRSDHMRLFRKRNQWFEKVKEINMVLWYVEDGQYPSLEEAVERLLHLREQGETPYAFTFKIRYTPQDLINWYEQQA